MLFMKTKKFEAATEQEALEKIRDELDLSAVILNIKKKPRKGLGRLFKNPSVVVTATYDDSEPKAKPVDAEKDLTIVQQQQSIRQLESKVQSTEEMVSQLANKLALAEQRANLNSVVNHSKNPVKYENPLIQMFYDSLLAQGVYPNIAEYILVEANSVSSQAGDDINLLVKIVYNKIIGILGEPRVLIGQNSQPQLVVFMGPTGVGKTTTIAKLASLLLIKQGKQVGLITADTYRIAAAEQLRTYASIIGLDLRIIYNSEEIIENVESLQRNHNVIFVDTAGRSHQKSENLAELSSMLGYVPQSDKFLVLSATTRQEDLLGIINAYASMADFDIIFTKLDETESIGIILNISYLTGRRVSYVSYGQNVPDDIEKIQADKIAKVLMGMGFGNVPWGEGLG